MKTITGPIVGNAFFAPFRNAEVTPFDKIFDDLLSKSFPQLSKEVGVNWLGNEAYPRVDIISYDDKIVIEADVHGLCKEDVNIEITDGVLTISGKKKESSSNQTGVYIKREIKRSSFRRSFDLSEKILKDKIEAKFENGLLSIKLPLLKEEVYKPQTIPIKIN
jgi:HSP20 family protein